MKETVHKVSGKVKLSISNDREDKYKLIYNHGERFIYLSETEMQKVLDILE